MSISPELLLHNSSVLLILSNASVPLSLIIVKLPVEIEQPFASVIILL